MSLPPPVPQNKGCAIAVASANGNTAKLHKVLRNVDGGTFTSDFFRSQAFQVSQLHVGARKSRPFGAGVLCALADQLTNDRSPSHCAM